MDNWKDALSVKLAEINFTVEELFTPPFEMEEVTHFLKALIEVAEELFPNPHSGPAKLELVMEMWDWHDQEYGLVKKLDELVDFRKIFGTIVGNIAEIWDAKAIRGLIENFAIPQLVKLLYPHGRLKKKSSGGSAGEGNRL